MSSLELKKKEVELKRVRVAREELELRIMECEDQIQRLKTNIDIQLAKEIDLEKELKEMRHG